MAEDPILTIKSEAQPTDLKLDACITFANTSLETPKLKTGALEPIVLVFRYNIARIRSMMLTPSLVGNLSTEIQQLLSLIEFEITGAVGNPISDENAATMSKLFMERYGKQKDEHEKLRGTPAWDKLVLEKQMMGAQFVNILARSKYGELGFEAMLSSYLTGTWTTFETLAGDLWEAALNINPAGLAHLRGSTRRLQKKDNVPFGSIKKPGNDIESKSVPLDLIQFHKFDLHQKMGTILRGRYEFSRLSNIRSAYSEAFDKDAKQIDDALSDDGLDSLSAVRNVLVHRAAIADTEYLRRSEHLSIPKAKVGQHIKLDGEITIGLIRPVISCSAKLIEGVDVWLDKHK